MKKVKQLTKREILTKKFSASLLSAFILGLFSPVFFYMLEANSSQEEINKLKNQIRDHEGFVNGRFWNLQSCRAQCRSDCVEECRLCLIERNLKPYNCGSDCEMEVNADPARCTDSMCDAGECRSAKAEYDEQHKKLEDFKQALAKLEGTAAQLPGKDESPLTQVRKKKNKMETYAILGAGTTALLGMKAYSCCSENPGCAETHWCPLWIGMTAAAAGATAAMVKKRSDLGKTEKQICAGNCPGTNDDGNGNNGNDEELKMPPDVPPACQGNEAQCQAVLNGINEGGFISNIPGEDCTSGDTSCEESETKTPSPPSPPPEIMTQGLTGLFNSPAFHNPDAGNPVIPKKIVNYKDLTPAQKKQVDDFMAPLNKKNKKWLAKMEKKNAKKFGGKSLSGFKGEKSGSGNIGVRKTSGGSPGLDEEDDVGEDLLAENSQSPGASSTFAGGDSRSVSALEPDEPIVVGAGRKNALADQMKKMLKNLYGGDGSGNNPIAEKSVQFGDDIVGVPEDNIFMMVHRRHRSLDTRKRFIGDTF